MVCENSRRVVNFERECLILFLFLCIALLSGCGASVKSDKEIASELRTNSTLLTDRTDIKVGVVTITKRQTDKDAKIDIVYADFDFEINDGTAEGNGSCRMTYGLYNDGWILDDVEVDSLIYTPLKGTEYTDKELIQYTKSCGLGYRSMSTTISNLQHEPDLGNNLDYYSFTMENTYQYMTEYLTITISSAFNRMHGYWTMDDVYCENTVEQWNHILGSYQEYANVFYTISEFDINAGEVDITYSRMYRSVYSDGTTGEWEISDYRGETCERIVASSPTEFFANRATMVTDYYKRYGYSVRLDNVDWNDIQFISTRSASGYGGDMHLLIITKNHIYFEEKIVADDYNRQFVITLRESIPLSEESIKEIIFGG